MDQLINAMF